MRLASGRPSSSAQFRIEVIQVPLVHPERAKVVNSPHLFADLSGRTVHEPPQVQARLPQAELPVVAVLPEGLQRAVPHKPVAAAAVVDVETVLGKAVVTTSPRIQPLAWRAAQAWATDCYSTFAARKIQSVWPP